MKRHLSIYGSEAAVMLTYLDMIRSVIIAGVILSIVVGIHFLTGKASLENRLTRQMQQRAALVMQVIEDEFRYLESIEETDDGFIVFRVIDVPETAGYDFVIMKRDSESLVIEYTVQELDADGNPVLDADGDPVYQIIESRSHQVNLTDLEFGTLQDKLLPVRLTVESDTSEYYQDEQKRFPGFAQKSFYLRNLQ